MLIQLAQLSRPHITALLCAAPPPACLCDNLCLQTCGHSNQRYSNSLAIRFLIHHAFHSSSYPILKHKIFLTISMNAQTRQSTNTCLCDHFTTRGLIYTESCKLNIAFSSGPVHPNLCDTTIITREKAGVLPYASRAKPTFLSLMLAGPSATSFQNFAKISSFFGSSCLICWFCRCLVSCWCPNIHSTQVQWKSAQQPWFHYSLLQLSGRQLEGSYKVSAWYQLLIAAEAVRGTVALTLKLSFFQAQPSFNRNV